MILLPKYRDLRAELDNSPLRMGVGGQFRLMLYAEDGTTLIKDTGFSSNVITDYGMDQISDSSTIGSQSLFGALKIGSGTTPALVTDTQMETFLAASNDTTGLTHTAYINPISPYECYKDKSARFPAGVGTGTVNEVGIGRYDTDGLNLFSRQLVTPGIVKGAAQVLDVIYRLTYYPPIVDALGTVTIDGLVYDTITRMYDADGWRDHGFQGIRAESTFVTSWGAYSGDIGPITGNPSGSLIGSDNDDSYNLTYGPGSYYRDMQHDCGLNGWNTGSGIRSMRIQTRIKHTFQTQFNRQGGGGETIPKDPTKIISLRWRIAWARH
jgi:hypothetical protein